MAKERESREVSAVLRSHERVGASFRLVGFQRAETDDPCAHAEQFCDVVLERPVRPPSATFPERRVHLSVFAASEERQLEPDRPAWGAPRVLKNHHAPLLTEQQWEAGQVKHDFVPRTGLSEGARLRGLVYCRSCGKRCKLSLYGPPGKRKTTYTCTYEKCSAHAGMRASKLDAHIDDLLWRAAAEHEPHVEAVILGDSRYTDALLVVEEARRAFEEFRDSVELQRELGIEGFAQGLKVRKEALELARRELAKVRRPAGSSGSKRRMSFEEFMREYERERYVQFIERVWLKPAGRVGSRVPPVEERVEVYFIGSDEPYAPEPIVGDPETLEILRAAHS